ncbi:hypothetical protein SAMN05216488_2760 [Microbacterium sp. LKL04]|uniref:Uncharacterized protein n=1 Tax=Microbacterium oleivorans TaxID=273677 RepID=A0A4R5YK39_9MICO|nr:MULTISPECIES: hypothetical protein [Microbacterium]MDQ1126316.1 hypothetical protein [Microbacterium sp. SORGH_AS_0505]TDL45566.1 hypothetical protein E2R54_03670 [Microbacterium oleivorans]SCY65490.1 hypothetical protein SAMN05216488_2760 [Microbacterium sp. LKL04]
MADTGVKTWSRGHRTREMTRVLRPAGFERRGDEWILDTSELRWWVHLGTAKWDAHEHELAVGSLILRDGEPDYDAPHPATFGLSDLPGASRRRYLDTDEAARDPLVLDTEALLIPLLARLRTIDSVIEMWLAGDVAAGTVSDSRPLQVWHAWLLAKSTDRYVLADRALRIAETVRWTPDARRTLADLGMPIDRPAGRAKNLTAVDRVVQRAYVRRFSPYADAERLPL